MKNKQNKICLYEHVETEPYGAELCCHLKYGGYCIFDRRDPNIDYSKCSNSRMVYPEHWLNIGNMESLKETQNEKL